MQVLTGIGVSPGVSIGEALVFDSEGYRIARRYIQASRVDAELERLAAAVEVAAQEIQQKEQAVSRELGAQYAAIFAAHLQMLRDSRLQLDLTERISQQHFSPEYAVASVLGRYAKVFRNLGDSYFSDRTADIFDIEKRLLRHLLGRRREEISHLTSPVMIMASNLTPSETVNLDRRYVRGMATEWGGSGSHTAIVASALGIPAVVGLGSFLPEVSGGDLVIIDGDHGRVILAPDEHTLDEYRSEAQAHRIHSKSLESISDLPAETADHVHIDLLANIEFPHEVEQPWRHGCDGVGLYRTEFLYLGVEQEPTEEDQYAAYCKVLRAFQSLDSTDSTSAAGTGKQLGSRPVVIRTLDLGADKLAAVHGDPQDHAERNPFLGLRSIRLSLRNKDLFRTQLRAILRASARGRAKIMFPLISSLAELRAAKTELAQVQAELDRQGIDYDRALEVGMMVEVPAAALLVDRFADEVDFFSVGTNDLIQYTLAVDRDNNEVANLYSASDPAVLRLLKSVVDAAQAANTPVCVCGQMSSGPVYTMLLLGLGITQLSVAPSMLSEIKQVCRSVTLDACRQVACQALTMDSADEVTLFLQQELKKILPEWVV